MGVNSVDGSSFNDGNKKRTQTQSAADGDKNVMDEYEKFKNLSPQERKAKMQAMLKTLEPGSMAYKACQENLAQMELDEKDSAAWELRRKEESEKSFIDDFVVGMKEMGRTIKGYFEPQKKGLMTAIAEKKELEDTKKIIEMTNKPVQENKPGFSE